MADNINNKTINAARGFVGNMTLVVCNSHMAETILALLFGVKIYSGSHTSIAFLKLDIRLKHKNIKKYIYKKYETNKSSANSLY